MFKVFWGFFLLLVAPAVVAQCNADFSVVKDSICQGDTMRFTNASTGSGTLSYVWDFGDLMSTENIDTSKNTKHFYKSSGAIQVTLIITDSSNCSDTLVKSVYIKPKPTAAFTQYNNCKQNQTNFVNTTTSGSDTVNQWKWFFGDGDSATAKNPLHTYADTGNYAVKVIALSNGGCVDTAKGTIRVYSKPKITIDDTVICAGSSINFDAVTIETTGLGYLWQFNDGTSSNAKSPLHTYNDAGYFKPQVRVTHGGKDSCFVRFDSITVHGLPIPDFVVPNDSQCYVGNNVCFTDLTTQGTLGKGTKTRTFVFGDGAVDEATPPVSATVCHNYTDAAGGSFPIALEITDSNGCFARKQVNGAVLIYADYTPAFSLNQTNTCTSTKITVTNTTSIDSGGVSKFAWIWGDGSTDSSGWATKSHDYTASGNYTIKLWVLDTNGCPKLKTAAQPITSTVFDFNPTVTPNDSMCYGAGAFHFSHAPNSAFTPTWVMGNGAMFSSQWSVNYVYPSVGRFAVKLNISAPGCNGSYLVDTITVLGPRASIGKPTNMYQCQIHDTVIFTGPGKPYLSTHGPSNAVSRLWDFGDAFAPQCTTDTKNGINVFVNCNFSRDSMNVKHWYTPGKEACYHVRLVLRDTLTGCADSNTADLPLQRPKARRDTTVTPIVPGLSFTHPDCLGPEGTKTKILYLQNTQPSCGREMFWVMWDSTCAARSGNFNNFWSTNDSFQNYQYNSPPCDTSGNVTVGLILRNGQDSSGNFCYDTAWYHNIFTYHDLYPQYTTTFNPAVNRCPGTTMGFKISDSTQSGITNYTWDYGDGSPLVSDNTYKYRTHTFPDKGNYTTALTLTNADGCKGTLNFSFSLGFDAYMNTAPTKLCIGEVLQMDDSIHYFDNNGAYWALPARAAAGKEMIYWDFSDGNGFATTGHNPTISFNKVGTYTVRMAVKDSSGCTDTIVKTDLIEVTGAYAHFSLPDTITCPQLVHLFDSSMIYDPLNYKDIPAGDSIATWRWEFGAGKPKSFIKNPFKDFSSGGSYTVSLRVTNVHGCADSTQASTFVKGPIPAFFIVSDTFGCQPLKITFRNQTTNANKYTWFFKDPDNTVLTTLSDTDVYHTYTSSGVFKPVLSVESSETDNTTGKTVTCKATFPDTSFQAFKKVLIEARPAAYIGFVNNCTDFSLDFFDSSTIDPGNSITSRLWDFGDGNTSNQTNPTHIYPDTGTYTITLVVSGPSGCADTARRVIAIAPKPTADFTIKNTCYRQTTAFTDSSFTNNAFVVQWHWDFGDGGSSVFKNPSRFYVLPGTYSVRLSILTNSGCRDSVTKNVTINPLPTVGFTMPNTCRSESVQFTNNTLISSGSLTYNWYFGDGQTSTADAPQHTYTSPGSFFVKQVATSDKSCADSLTTPITIYPRTQPNFLINDSGQCINTNSFSFNNQTSLSSGTFNSTWHFGDGGLDFITHTGHHYNSPGIYTVRLTTVTNFGCADSMEHSTYVFPKPLANFAANTTAQCLNVNKFIFTNQSADTGSMTYNWAFGDGGVSTQTNPQKTYGIDTTFDVKLISTNGNGCKDTIVKTMTVWPVPKAIFAINDNSQCVNNNQFIFTNNSTMKGGTPLSAFWDFGDGLTSGFYNTTHTYTYDSTYHAILVATSVNNCRDTTFSTLFVWPKPTISFAINDTDQCVNGNVFVFTNTSNIKSGSIPSYKWRYGNGDSSLSTSPAYGYAKDSTYNVILIGRSDHGCVDSTTRQVIVFPKPKSKYTVNDSDQCLNTNAFQFTNTSTIKYGSMTHSWDFGNGNQAAGLNANVIYAKDSTYKVTLISRSNNNCYDTFSNTMVVYPVPVPKFAINDSDQCINENKYVFTNQTTINNGTFTHQWKFGTENGSTALSPQYVFLKDTNYMVRLIETSNYGCIDSVSRQITVFPKPTVKFIINDSDQCVNANLFVFTNQSIIKYGTLSYNWDFNEGKTSTAKDTSIVYVSPFPYNVRLIVTSNFNCKDTLYKPVIVYPKPYLDFTVNDSDQCLSINQYKFGNLSSISSGTLTFLWTFGDGNSSTVTHPVYSYAADSLLMTVKLVTTSNHGCKDSASHGVTVFPNPEAEFAVNDSGQCVNANLFAFTNESTVKYGNLQYAWDFGNGESCNCLDSSINYTYDTTNIVALRVISNYGCKDSAFHTMEVYSKPYPAYAVNDSDQCVNINLFSFTNNTVIKTGTMTYNWAFGDATNDTATNPFKVYAADTVYNIRLLATSNYNCKDSVLGQVTVFPKPHALFTVNDSTQCINTNNMVFTNNSYVKNGVVTSHWDYGNGDTSVAVNPVYNYMLDSTYAVTLIVLSDKGCYDTAGHTMVLFPKPMVKYSINDSDQCMWTQSFEMTDSSYIKYGTLSDLWIYSDGTRDTTKNAKKKFNNPGNYTIKLLLTSDELCTDSLETPVIVYPHPLPDFSGLKPFYCQLDPALPLIPVVSGGVFSGINVVDSSYNPQIRGYDTVKYVVERNGCYSDTSKVTLVYPLPVLNLGPDTSLCLREFIMFNVGFPDSKYRWQDGVEDSIYKVTKPGTYHVVLINRCGILKDTINVSYRDYDCNFFVPTAFTPGIRDNLNNIFMPWFEYEDVVGMHMQIYSRWGQLIFESNSKDIGWDGKVEDEFAPADVYLWKIDLELNEKGFRYTQTVSGTVTLIR